MSSYNQAVHISAHILKITHFCRSSSNEYQEAADIASLSHPHLAERWETTAARRCSFTESLSVWLRRYGIEEFGSGPWVDPLHLSLKPLRRILEDAEVEPRLSSCMRAEEALLEEVRKTIHLETDDEKLRQLLLDMELHTEESIAGLIDIAQLSTPAPRSWSSLAS